MTDIIQIPNTAGNCEQYPEIRQDREETVKGKIVEYEAQSRLTNIIGTPQMKTQLQNYYKDIKPLADFLNEEYYKGYYSVNCGKLWSGKRCDGERRGMGERYKQDALAKHLQLCKEAVNKEATDISTEITKLENAFLSKQAQTLTPIGAPASDTSSLTTYYIIGAIILIAIAFFAYKIFKK